MPRAEKKPEPSWRDAAMVARQQKVRRKIPPVRAQRDYVNWEFVQAVVVGEYPYPNLTLTEAILVACMLVEQGFSIGRIAERLGVCKRSVHRYHEAGRKRKEEKAE